MEFACPGVDPAQVSVVIRDERKYAEPDPDLFLAAAGEGPRSVGI